MVRYADDFVIFARNKEDNRRYIWYIKSFILKDRNLKLAEGIKTIDNPYRVMDLIFWVLTIRRFKNKKWGFIYRCQPSKSLVLRKSNLKWMRICKELHGHNDRYFN